MALAERLKKALGDPEMARLVVASLVFNAFAPKSSRSASGVSLPAIQPSEEMRITEILNSHGSDKANRHSYAGLYAAIFQQLPVAPRILELGIGSNYSDVPCNIGKEGVPGASLRAWSEIRPLAKVFGADIDRRVLFQDGNISTCWVDQLEPATIRRLLEFVGGEGSLNLVIDDGLHTKRSNLNTFRELFRAVQPGGFYVIEDVGGDALDFWRYLIRQGGLRASVFDMRHERSNWDINNLVVVAA